MSSSTQGDQIEELLGYLKNIKSYERQYQRSEASSINMIFGLFILVAAFTDLNISLIVGVSPQAIPWFAGIAAGVVARQIISSQPLLFDNLTEESTITRQNISKTETIIIIIGFLLTFPISMYSSLLVMPYIGIVFGTANLFAFLGASGINQNTRIFYMIEIAAFYLSSLINLILGFLIKDYTEFSGFIFGILVGSTTFIVGYKSRQALNQDLRSKEK